MYLQLIDDIIKRLLSNATTYLKLSSLFAEQSLFHGKDEWKIRQWVKTLAGIVQCTVNKANTFWSFYFWEKTNLENWVDVNSGWRRSGMMTKWKTIPAVAFIPKSNVVNI